MATKVTRRVEWAGVEFQPNLQTPQKPVPLDVVVHEITSGVRSLYILGRIPRLDPRPAAFEHVSATTFELAASWVNSMFADILEANDEDVTDPFTYLAGRWRWNLYPINAVRRKKPDANLLLEAKRVYKQFVGHTFSPGGLCPHPTPVAAVTEGETPAVTMHAALDDSAVE